MDVKPRSERKRLTFAIFRPSHFNDESFEVEGLSSFSGLVLSLFGALAGALATFFLGELDFLALLGMAIQDNFSIFNFSVVAGKTILILSGSSVLTKKFAFSWRKCAKITKNVFLNVWKHCYSLFHKLTAKFK